MKFALPFLQKLQTNFREPASRLPRAIGTEKTAELLARWWQKLALLGLWGLGLFLGAKTARHTGHGWQARLLELLRAQRMGRAGQGVFASAAGYFGTDFLFLLAAFLLGLCAAGLPFLLLLPVLRGLGTGVVSGWMYMTYGAAGMGYSLLVFYPAAVISVLLMIGCCKESMAMSGDMLLLVTDKLPRAESTLRVYTSKYLLALLLSLVAALLDALCFSAFSGIFEI